jgi:hypothetical protein
LIRLLEKQILNIMRYLIQWNYPRFVT